MADKERLRAWLIIDSIKYLKNKHLHQLLEHYSVEQLINFPAETLQSLGFSDKQIPQILFPDEKLIARLIAWGEENQQHLICYDCPAYPESLKQISSSPKVLYGLGNIELLKQTQVAIVGSRNASHYGLDNAYHFAAELAKQGIVVTSGFASGVDGKAHMGALAGGGNTIAVLGTGVDVVYPARHKPLAHDIQQHGLLLSEFPPGTPARAQHFPRRNRIISGLSQGVLVVEAAVKSGSLITAKYALEQNKEVFAIPGSIHEPRAKGNHQLLKQGAKLTESVTDIIEELVNWQAPQIEFELDSTIKKVEKSTNKNFTTDPLLVNLSYEVTSIDQLVDRSQLPVDVVLNRLLELELQGLIAAVSGGYVKTRRDEYV